jgi:hypothetical protein
MHWAVLRGGRTAVKAREALGGKRGVIRGNAVCVGGLPAAGQQAAELGRVGRAGGGKGALRLTGSQAVPAFRLPGWPVVTYHEGQAR